MDLQRTEGERSGFVLCELIEEDVFVSLDTFIYKGIKAKRSIKLECMFRGVLLSC